MLLDEPQIRLWSKREYHQAAELGWFDTQRVELLDGEVVTMPPQKDAHAFGVRLAANAMNRRCGPSYTVLVQMPLNLGSSSEPEPDVAVVKGSIREVTSHPTSAELIIEVSDTTLAFDRVRKASLYAQHRIAEYWIVNLLDRQVEIFRRPAGAEWTAPFAPAEIMRTGKITPVALAIDPVDVAELLP